MGVLVKNLSFVLWLMTFFTAENLKKLRFKSNAEVYEHLQIEALKEGFRLSCRQALSSKYGEFHCSYGGRAKNKTSKTNCQWKFKTTVINENGIEFIGLRMDSSLCLQHNHITKPMTTSHKIISDNVKDIIDKLSNAGVKPYQIKDFLEQQGIGSLTTSQIAAIAYRKKLNEFGIQSEALINYVKQMDGTYFVKETSIGNKTKRVAVLTFVDNEIDNLINYGDVLFIDGTQMNNELNWEVIPITGITKEMSICCCGILFTAINTQELLQWMLKCLWKNQYARSKYHTFITDEDQAFTSAFENFITHINTGIDGHINIKHVLCALHKKKNFLKHLAKCSLNHKVRNEAINMFDTLAFSTNKDLADDALVHLKNIHPKLTQYIEEEIEPLIYHFSKSHIGEHFTAGYNTTSVAESMNRMLKRSLIGKKHTLLQLRMHFSSVLKNHSDCVFLSSLHYRILK